MNPITNEYVANARMYDTVRRSSSPSATARLESTPTPALTVPGWRYAVGRRVVAVGALVMGQRIELPRRDCAHPA